MESFTAPETKTIQNVGLGGVLTGQGPTKLATVLGSCVAVAVYDPAIGIASLGHVILPDSHSTGCVSDHSGPGRYADTAIRYIIRMLCEQGATPENLAAKISGGARLFGETDACSVGTRTIEAVQNALRKAGVNIEAEHLGGRCGRRISLDCESGELAIETLESPPVII